MHEKVPDTTDSESAIQGFSVAKAVQH